MKYLYLLSLILLSQIVLAQVIPHCGQDDFTQNVSALSRVSYGVKSLRNSDSIVGTVYIPVVIHVIYKTNEQNVSVVDWDVAGMHMQLRANLTTDETKKVIDFMKSAN